MREGFSLPALSALLFALRARALPLSLFEQPAIRAFQQPAKLVSLEWV